MSSELPPPKRSAIQAKVHQLVSRALGVVSRRDDNCIVNGVDKCKKPTVSSQGTTWIIVGVIVGIIVVSGLSVMLFLHLKNKKRNEREDLEDRFQMADYGLDDAAVPGPKKGSKGTPMPGEGQPKLSLDDSLGTNGRLTATAPGLGPRGGGGGGGYTVNPFVSPAENDAASIKSIDLNPKWHHSRSSDSPASSTVRLPPPTKNL